MAAALALLTSVLWGVGDFLGGTVSRRLSAYAVYFGSQVVAFVLFAAVATLTGAWAYAGSTLPWSPVAALLGMVGLISFYTALATGTMGVVAPVAALSVLVPLVLGLVRGERLTLPQAAGIALAITGVILACGPEIAGPGSSRPIVLAGVSAVAFGTMFVAMAEASRTSALMATTMMRACTAVIAIGLALGLRRLGGLTRSDLPSLTAIGLTDSGANLTWGIAAGLGMLSVTSVLASLYPVVTAVLAAVVHHERLTRVQYAGIAAVVSGVALLSVRA